MNTINNEFSFFKDIWPIHSQYIFSSALGAVSKLGIANIVSEGALTPQEISQKLGFKTSNCLTRLLRFLASQQIFQFDQAGRVLHTPSSVMLRSDQLGSKIAEDQKRNWQVLKEVDESFLEGLSPIKLDHPSKEEKVLWKKARGYLISRALYMAVKIGLPELLKEAPLNQQEVEQKGLKILMKHLVKGGFCKEEKGAYQLTALGNLLLDKGCQAFIKHEDEVRWMAVGKMDQVVATGIPSFSKGDYFEQLSKDKEKVNTFDKAMTFITECENPELIPALKDFLKPGMTVVDVGGGQGRLLAALLRECPGVQGILFDLPETINKHAIPEELLSRCQLQGGDFFKELPKGDIYLIKRVLHDWDNKDCIKIMSNIALQMNEGGKIILNEMLLPDPFVLTVDMLLMTLVTGEERSMEDYKNLLEKAGFQLTACKATSTWLSIMVGEK